MHHTRHSSYSSSEDGSDYDHDDFRTKFVVQHSDLDMGLYSDEEDHEPKLQQQNASSNRLKIPANNVNSRKLVNKTTRNSMANASLTTRHTIDVPTHRKTIDAPYSLKQHASNNNAPKTISLPRIDNMHKPKAPTQNSVNQPQQQPSQPQGFWDTFSQLKDLEEQNHQLRFEMDKKVREIKSLKQELSDSLSLQSVENCIADSLRANKGASDIGIMADMREQKIVELAKKMRRLTIALEKERSNNSKLHNKVKQLELQSRQSTALAASLPGTANAKSNGDETEIRSLREKLANTNRRLEEERILTQSLRSDLRNSQKALTYECGEDVDVAKILEAGPAWKGRMQTISMLKEKVKELQRQLSINTPGGSVNGSMVDLAASDVHGERHRNSIRQLQKERMSNLEKTTKELNDLRVEHLDLRAKHESAIARTKYV